MKNAAYAVLFVLVLAASATLPADADAEVGKDTSRALRIPACPPADVCTGVTCLAKRVKAWGKFQSCVAEGMAIDYVKNPENWDTTLKGCRKDYFGTWKPCHGPRFVKRKDGTVRDRLTRLVWEVKTNVGGDAAATDPHDVNEMHTWSKEDGLWEENGDAFTGFLESLNAGSGYAGSNGWRLPTMAELLTLLDWSKPRMVPGFPDVQNTASAGYWTATTYPPKHGGCKHPSSCAWNVAFKPGAVNVDGKKDGRPVRAVREGL